MKELRPLIVELNKNGKSHITAKCPFCEREFTVLTWNSFGFGRRCSCGALLGRFGCIKEENKNEYNNEGDTKLV